MRRRSFMQFAVSCAGLAAFGAPAPAADGIRASGPVVHENLAIYFIHGPSTTGPVPLTLQEALVKGRVTLHETGNVSQLAVENSGDEEVFIQSGDIVKGGRQDRVLMVSLTLPPKSGRVSLASFCVESGRWSARGAESARVFSSSTSAMPSREAKVAMKRAAVPTVATTGGSPARTASTPDTQQMVWDNVSRIQRDLSSSLKAPVAAPESQTSLQLALENEKLKAAQAAYVKALQSAGEQDSDIVGYVFAINGKINSGDLYPSNGLFRKMWPKLLNANVTEAIAEKGRSAGTPPSTAAVLAFLDNAKRGNVTEKALTQGLVLEVRDSDATLYAETKRSGGGWVHRNYLAK